MRAAAVALTVPSETPAAPPTALRWIEAPPTAVVGRAWTAALELTPRASHPFDPDEVALDAEIQGPEHDTFRVPLAWVEPYRARPPQPPRFRREWMEPEGEPHWRLTWRFQRPGPHTVAVVARVNNACVVTSSPLGVVVAPGTVPPRLRVSRRDPRFFELDDGRPWFAIGQNLCFIGPMQKVTPSRVATVIGRLAAHGVNYLRIWTGCDDWAISLEPGRGGPGPSPERWPVHERGVTHRGMGEVNQPDAAMLDLVVEAAEAAGVRLHICLLTRDRYMRRLRDPASPDYAAAIRDARRLFRYAVARWGASPAVAVWEYWNEIDPSLPAGRFYRELAAFLDETDPWRRPRTASAWAPAPALWRDPAIQLADLHWYLRPAWGQLWTDAAAAVLERAAFLRHHAPDRPAILSEFGLADDQWRHSPWMRQDTALRHVHDALWASALSGLAGTAMFWWWETLEDMGAERCYAPLARFLDGFDWTGGVEPLRVNVPSSLLWAGLRVRDDVRMWIREREATWHREVAEHHAPRHLEGVRIELAAGRVGTWNIEWVDPESGDLRARETLTDPGPTLRLAVPPFTREIALRAAVVPNASEVPPADRAPPTSARCAGAALQL